MARIFKTPFGAQGDTEQVPEAPQGDGSVSLTQGFGYDYEREYEDPAAKDIRREVMNGLFHDITEAIGDIQMTGIAKWDAAAAPYPAGAVLWHSSVAWMSTAGNNSSVPGAGADWTEFRGFSLRENIKVTVGAGGDFPTINAAVLHLSRFTPDLGVTAEVELQSGFVMMEQLFVEGLDLGWLTITGVDAETVINEPSLTRVLALNARPAFGVTNGTLPTIGQLFIFSSKGSAGDRRAGVLAHAVGRATILDGCGVKNAGYDGILASGSSTINANGAIASGAGSIGIDSVTGSTINANGADASGAGGNCIGASSGSTINAEGADASGAGVNGFLVQRGSTINAWDATGTPSQAKNTVTANGIIFQP